MRFSVITIMLSLLLIVSPSAFAQKQTVEITPVKKITTAGEKLSEGDFVQFRTLDSNDLLEGLVVKYEPNGFGGKTAILVIDNFRNISGKDKFTGTISLEGNPHNGIMEFFVNLFPELVRGGEVTILPLKDKFTLWRE